MMKFEIPFSRELNLLLAQFKKSGREHSYRQEYLNNDRFQSMLITIFGAIATGAFGFTDYYLFGISRKFYFLILIKLLLITIAVVNLIVFPRLKEEKTLDRINFLWAMIFCSAALHISSTRPPEYTFHFLIEIIIIFSIYVLLPNRFLFQVIPATYLTFGILAVLLTVKDLSPASTLAIGWAILFSNLFGLWLSWKSHIDRRIQFHLLSNEKELSRKLEKVIETTKTLEGLLPICASCKNIRDDEGYWHQVEVYVNDHTDAKFSHSICPECTGELYPEHHKK